MPFADAVIVTEADVERGEGPVALAHELAHRREGILTNIFDERADRLFWKELAVWESTLDKGFVPTDEECSFIKDALGTYLGGVADDFGHDSKEYRECLYGCDRFLKKYL
jgi:hypothetical protein